MLMLPLPELSLNVSSSGREIAGQVLLERSPISGLNRALSGQRLPGLLTELAQPFLVGGIQLEEISLVGCGHTQSQIEKRLAGGEIRHEPRRGRERDVLDFGRLGGEGPGIGSRGVTVIEQLADA